jgi:hypothetical protein
LVLCGLFLGGICGKDEEAGDEQVDQIVSQWVVPNNRVYPFMVLLFNDKFTIFT